VADTPETIYLIPGEYEEGLVWCDDPAPDSYSDPAEAVKYVRADIHESALKRQGNAAKMGMDAAKKDAIWREENAKRLLAESNPAAIESERAMNAELTEEIELLQHALSRQGKMLSAIVNITKGPPKENTLHSTHDAVESVERLQARVAEME
jgi:sRNA-binding carbon storage regulator CsrA